VLAPPDLEQLMAFLGETFRRPDPVSGCSALEQRCAERVTGNSRLTPAEQVDIYRRQFWLRHLDALAEDYPGTKYLLGEDAFEAFCRAYLASHPPNSPSLRDLGNCVIGFAERYPHFPEATRAAAVEMIRYENAFVDLFDGADVLPLDPQKLATLPPDAWEHARIVLHPLLVRLRVTYPVHRIRLEARGAGQPIPAPLAPAPENLVLYRRDDIIHFEELDPTAFDLLDALARGEPLVSACDRIAKALDPAAAEALGAQVGPWFQQWTALRWIVDIDTDR
jgi:hypothetical protein